MSQRRIKAVPVDDRRERMAQELFSLHKQIAEHWEKSGTLWAHVDGNLEHSADCFRTAANHLEKAVSILEEAAAVRIKALGDWDEMEET
jgi:hypothetical protein